MNGQTFPLTHDVVLVGGGHSHALVLRMWGMRPMPGARLTLINPEPNAAYSGMLPGYVAGHYDREDLDINLVRLARFANARLILGSVTHIDTEQRIIHVPDRPAIGYDVASLDVGVTSTMAHLPGFSENAIPAKPLGAFASRWSEFISSVSAPAQIVVIGAGVAGAELAMAMAHRLRKSEYPGHVTLIDRSEALSTTGVQARVRIKRSLKAYGIRLLENAEISRIEANEVVLGDGTFLPANFVTGAAGATPHPWLRHSGLNLAAGYVTVSETLQTNKPEVFAVGDCAHFSHAPRPKAGVFAVRQAPVLFHNLRAALAGKKPRPYRPQKSYLKLVSLGDTRAIVDRPGLPALAGAAIWRWKNHIDQKFMHRLNELTAMPQPRLPRERTETLDETLGDKPMCGGCGAKVGRETLNRALAAPSHPSRGDITLLPGDDSALLHTGGVLQAMTSDHLRAFTSDPVMMTRIAANHALGDIWAMAADPQAATATLILPRQTETLQARMLAEIMAAARAAMREAGAEIVGGHTSLGDELTIGFTLTGICDERAITLKGARPADALILTKPIGSGTLLAAEMQLKAKGVWIASAFEHMCQSQSKASHLLRHAHAMTDVTGFGLAGHLLNICQASSVSAVLSLDAIPLLQGALPLASQGIRSTLFPQNKAIAPYLPDTSLTNLLFDPQTAGGLLAAVAPDTAETTLNNLRASGYPASIIGHITKGPAMISLI